MKQHNINGITVYEYGVDNEPPVIFIHAFPMTSRMWDPQVEEFQDRYRVIVYDLRGFGFSDQVSGPYTIDTHADDLINVVESLKITNPVVCGLSMGAYILLRAAEKYPAKFRALILSDTKSEADDNAGKIKRAGQIKQIRSGGRNAFIEAFLNNAIAGLTQGGNDQKTKAYKFAKDIMSTQKEKNIASALLTLAARTDTTDSLKNINIPVLVLVGEDDKITPPEQAKKINAGIKNSVLSIIPNSGHFPNLENSSAFNLEIEKFIERLK
jgi:pimeloyl-ACP methyl ester carboxylesterase